MECCRGVVVEVSGGIAVEVRLLGPVQVIVADGPRDVGPPQRSAVLAALGVDAGRLVTVDSLIDRVWGDAPADGARRSLHAHVARIRRLLAECADGDPVTLTRRPGGYVLQLDPERVDVHRFRDLVRHANNLADTPADEAAVLQEALALWHGEPLAGLAGAWAERTRQSWRQEHEDAILAWARAELRAGNPAAVIGPLSGLAEENPFWEPLIAVLMCALHAVGRPTRALELYTSTRNRLIEALGAEPGTELREAHRAVLRDDPPSPSPATAAASSPVPAQLPRDIRGFAGREKIIGELDALLPATAGAVVISAIDGTAGVGKTALAVHWAHQVADRFPDGQLYVDLRGFDPEGSVVAPADAVRRFLDALQVPPERIPVDLDAQAALYRTQLAGRRMLVVLDNARDSAQVRPLLPAVATCLVLVTSRNQLTGLIAADGAHPINLDLLSTSEARELLTQRLGADRIAAEPDAVQEIITRCARLPLALALVAARATARPAAALQVFAGELANTQQRWLTLTGDDPHTDVRAVFSWSYQALTPPAALLFRLLGLHPGPDIGAAAAASLAGLAPDAVWPVLAELTRANLLIEPTLGRYTFHDLLRDYATQLGAAIDTDEQRHAATGRILDHYLHTAHLAEQLLDPASDPPPLASPRAGVTPQPLSDHAQALDWLTVERQVLRAAVAHAAARGFDTHTWQLAWALWTFLARRGHWHDRVAVGQAAVDAAQRLADPTAQARSHRLLAGAYTLLGQFDDAHTQLQRALDLSTATGDPIQQAHTHQSLTQLWDQQGQPVQALHHARQALHLYQAIGDQAGQARALNNVGWCHTLLGEHEQALTHCRQALTLHQQLGHRLGEAGTWDSLGYAYHHLGRHTEAITCYQHALTLFRDLGDRYLEAIILDHLGDTHDATGNPQAARDAWRQALGILTDLEHPDAADVRAKLEGLLP